MPVKMPVLGDSSRRRRRSSLTPWVLVAVALAGSVFGWRWWRKHPRVAPPPAAAALPQASPPPSAPPPAAGPSEPRAAPRAHRRLSLHVDGALETALVQDAGRDTGRALAQVLKRLLVWWMRVPADLQRGDRIDLVYEESPNEEPVIHAVRVVSGKLQKTLEAFRFRADSAAFARYYLPDGEELELRLVPSPLDSYEQVTSLIRDGRGHRGVDFKTPVGSPVLATFDGAITRKNWAFRANGNSLEVTEASAPNRKALFLHLSELPKTLKLGTTVSLGEVIAHSGNSGHSFAPHLHYQLESFDGRVLDPFLEHHTRRASVSPSDRDAFERAVAMARQELDQPTGSGATSGTTAPEGSGQAPAGH